MFQGYRAIEDQQLDSKIILGLRDDQKKHPKYLLGIALVAATVIGGSVLLSSSVSIRKAGGFSGAGEIYFLNFIVMN